MDDDVKPDVSSAAEALNVKVVNQEGNEVHFRCKPSTKMEKLMQSYCQRQGLNMSSVRFLFDGDRINATQTAEEVRLTHENPERPVAQ